MAVLHKVNFYDSLNFRNIILQLMSRQDDIPACYCMFCMNIVRSSDGILDLGQRITKLTALLGNDLYE
jgi:hypothetical protein